MTESGGNPFLRGFGRGIGRLLAALVGTWSPPGWLRAIVRQFSRLGVGARANRGAATVAGLAAALVITGGGWTAYWYKHRPKPTGFTVTVNAPGITAAEPGATPDTLTLDFNGSVAPLKLVGKTLNPKHLPTLSPKIDGTWRWSSDSQLSFAVAPGKDWPIGARYTVDLPKRDLLKEGALLDEYSLKFTTPLFTAAISESQFYQDPTDASLKKVVATVHFSHPVETASFEKRIHMQLDSRIRTEPSQPWKFHVTYDKYKLNAYLHSEPLVVPESDHTFQIKIDDGLAAARGGPSTKDALSATVNVPGVFSFFRIENVAVTLVDNERFEPEQVLVLTTTPGVAQKELAQNLSAWVLPINDPTNPKETPKHPHDWSDVTQVGPQALKAAKPLTLESLATEKEYDTTLTFRYHADPGRYIYVLAKKGIRAFGGYVLGEPWQGVVRVGDYPPVLHIMQNGALVSLGGSRKVSLYARDVGAVHFEVGRVLPDQLQHLVSQTSGSFASPDFVNDSNFGADNLVERFESVQELGAIVHGKPQYLGFDLSTYLQSGGNGKRGLFLLRAESWFRRRSHRRASATAGSSWSLTWAWWSKTTPTARTTSSCRTSTPAMRSPAPTCRCSAKMAWLSTASPPTKMVARGWARSKISSMKNRRFFTSSKRAATARFCRLAAIASSICRASTSAASRSRGAWGSRPISSPTVASIDRATKFAWGPSSSRATGRSRSPDFRCTSRSPIRAG